MVANSEETIILQKLNCLHSKMHIQCYQEVHLEGTHYQMIADLFLTVAMERIFGIYRTTFTLTIAWVQGL